MPGKNNGGCEFTDTDRGDCEHFVKIPEKLDEKTTNEYGKPYGWCWRCWYKYKLDRLRTQTNQAQE